jgi:hypothetical protein
MAKTRISANLSAEALAIVAAYQAKNKIKDRGTALDLLILEFGGAHPQPEPGPTKYDVEISQAGGYIHVRKGTAQIGSVTVKGDVAGLFKIAVEAVPSGGSLGIGEGTYELEAPYPFPLDADGSNIFYCCIPILDRSMHISGAGPGKTVLKLAAWQRSANRHVAMMLIRGTGPMAPGYSSFSVDGLTLDGNVKYQYSGTPHDGEALLLIGSEGKNGIFRNLEFRNSYGSGFYRGNNGSGSGSNELVRGCVARSCADKGIMLDTCQDSRVEDCQAWACGEGLCLYGNDDWQTGGADRVTVAGFRTDSQVMIWQVNDFKLHALEMDCSKATSSYGLVVRDGYGQVADSKLKSDKKKASAYGSATYIYRGADVALMGCDISGYYGIRAIEKAKVRANACTISASGACFAMVDKNAPMEASIIAEGCKCTGKKVELQDGASFEEL